MFPVFESASSVRLCPGWVPLTQAVMFVEISEKTETATGDSFMSWCLLLGTLKISSRCLLKYFKSALPVLKYYLVVRSEL